MSNLLWAILLGLVVPLGAIFGGLVLGMWLGWRERRYWERRAHRRQLREERRADETDQP